MEYDTKLSGRNLSIIFILSIFVFLVGWLLYGYAISVIISFMYIMTCFNMEHTRINRNILIKEMQLLKLNLECDRKCLETKRKKIL
jgi:hypothetical protein